MSAIADEEAYEARLAAARSRRMVLPAAAIGIGSMLAASIPQFAGALPLIVYGILTFGSLIGGGLAIVTAVAGMADYRKVVAGMGMGAMGSGLTVYLPALVAIVTGLTAAALGLLGFLLFELV